MRRTANIPGQIRKRDKGSWTVVIGLGRDLRAGGRCGPERPSPKANSSVTCASAATCASISSI